MGGLEASVETPRSWRAKRILGGHSVQGSLYLTDKRPLRCKPAIINLCLYPFESPNGYAVHKVAFSFFFFVVVRLMFA